MAMATHQREEEVKWVNHYSSNEVIKKYKNGKSNLLTLVRMGAFVLHGVNATKMKFHPDLQMRWFDRIVFNFPHAGFYGKEDNNHMIGMHRDLSNGFFENASTMLSDNGEVHVSHKTTPPFDCWNLKDLAFKNSLSLIEPAVEFKMEDYPGYNNKRGDGQRCDDPFPLGECSTFRFELSPAAKKIFNAKSFNGFPRRRSQQLQDFSIQFQKPETSFDSRHMNAITGHVGLPLAMNNQKESPNIYNGCYGNISETFRRAANHEEDYIARVSLGFDSFGQPQRNVTRNMNDFSWYMGLPLTSDSYVNNVRGGNHVDCNVHGSHFTGFGRCMANEPGRMLNGDLSVSNEDQRLSTLRRMVRDYGA
ncbi:hypothetical protein Dsin_022047 [Dipteronia sinensis]|uniref:25S rRNA (uridine-N(3))-methyltransferase BMT5-like domain-containing protein n=1 Tax=Dipteronia sinensis TaxID=43782 RepID=A0AAE0A1M4_9ROSI|nr:hypothetical protein Dsin_022047 [Dipteronia sinensis]